MNTRTVKSISFKNGDPYEEKLLEHAAEYPNFSVYVKRLIQRDMEGGNGSQTATLVQPEHLEEDAGAMETFF